jgi:SAM-dependent methyltransferase
VTLLNVIEHLNSPRSACEEILRILEPGGVVVMATPNTQIPLPLIKVYTAVSGSRDVSARFPRTISQIHPPNHLFFYTAETLRQLLIAAGFQSVTIRNAAPIINLNLLRTSAKITLYSIAEVLRFVSAGHFLAGHSLLAYGYKPAS